MDGEADAWFDRELAGCSLADERLNKRLRKLVAQIGGAMGQSIPLVCQDWANTKAAYRFSQMTELARRKSWVVTFDRRVTARSPPMVPFLYSMTRRSSPIKERTRKRSG
ncbi:MULTISPECIES: IS4/Tn5 family transposase DNA-binding protein [Bradyrhizobium]|uniref:IS4/Tn5 family transposase DNA-binding protein n=1 Tax=Bradyrhizobium TaxID=374 RepID=UPI001FD9CF7D|nr:MULTISPECIES: transposase [Bradyrhizobium]